MTTVVLRRQCFLLFQALPGCNIGLLTQLWVRCAAVVDELMWEHCPVCSPVCKLGDQGLGMRRAGWHSGCSRTASLTAMPAATCWRRPPLRLPAQGAWRRRWSRLAAFRATSRVCHRRRAQPISRESCNHCNGSARVRTRPGYGSTTVYVGSNEWWGST